MSKKTAIPFLSCSLVLLSIIMVWQTSITNRLRQSLEQTAASILTYKEYIAYTSVWCAIGGTDAFLSLLFDYAGSSSLVVYVPVSVCRSCFTSLMFYLQDSGFSMDEVVVLSQNNDISLKRETKSYGSTFYCDDFFDDEIADIVVFRKVKGFLPISMRYKQGYDVILSAFLDDTSYQSLFHLDPEN